MVTVDTLQTRRSYDRGRLIASVIHDLNNHLTGVMAYAELMESSRQFRDMAHSRASLVSSG